MWYVAGAQLVFGVTVRWVVVASQLRFTGTFGSTWSELATLVGSIGALKASVIGARTDVFAAMEVVKAALSSGTIGSCRGVASVCTGAIAPRAPSPIRPPTPIASPTRDAMERRSRTGT